MQFVKEICVFFLGWSRGSNQSPNISIDPSTVMFWVMTRLRTLASLAVWTVSNRASLSASG